MEPNEESKSEIERLRARISKLEAQQKNDYAGVLHASALAFLKKLTRSDLLEAIISQAAQLLDAEHGFLYLMGPNRGVMHLRGSRGMFKGNVGTVIQPGDTGLISSVWENARIEIVDDYDQWQQRHPGIVTGQFASAVGVPLFSQSQVIGVIALAFIEPVSYLLQDQIDALKGFADLASIALENAHLHERLQEGERFIQQVADTTPLMLSIYDLEEQRIIYQNQRVSQILGRSLEDNQALSLEGLINLTHPDDVSKVTEQWSSLISKENGMSSPPIDYRVQHKNGSYRWLRSRFVIFQRHADSSPRQLLNITEDVTERYTMKAAQRRSETRFRSIFENAPLGVAMINTDGRLIHTNPRFTEMFGYRADELLSMTYRDVSVPPASKAEKALIAEMQAGERTSYQIEKEYQRKDRTTFWGRLTSTYMEIDNERIDLRVIEDITEQRTAKEALRQSETRIRMLMDNVPVWVALYKRDKGLVYINPVIMQMSTYEDGELLGEAFLRILPDEVREDLNEQRNIYLETGELTDRQEIYIITKTGEERWIELNLKHIELDDEPAVLGTGLDITERKQAEKARIELAVQRKQVRFLADFVRDVGHDFRTPLSVIATSLHILERTSDAEARRQRVGNIREQVFHLEKLLDSLMVLVRHDSSVPMSLTQVDVNQLIRDTVKSMRKPIDAAEHTLELTLTDPLPPVRGSNSELHRAIKNLLENSIRYTPQGGKIQIHTVYEAGEVKINIMDNGIGITAEHLTHIFDRFYRVNQARSSTGLGLGLPIVRKIIERHEGVITVDSTPDVGSKFTITLAAVTHISSASAR